MRTSIGGQRTSLHRIAQRFLPLGGRDGMPRQVERKLARMGAVIDTQATAAIYAPLHEREPYLGVRVVRDVSYGPDERHMLDVFVADPPPPAAPSGPQRRLPVLMFVHGGGFFGGDRRVPEADSPFYDNVMLLAARHGMVGVNATYRLVPQHPWPAGAEDVAAALRWLRRHIDAYGGDPERVIVMGHSAGAVHVACYLAHRAFHAADGLGPAGAILVSGLYQLSGRPLFDGERLYFGDDPSAHAGRAPLPGLADLPIPLMTVTAALDPPVFHAETANLNAALADAGRPPRTLVLPRHNHISEILALNTTDTSFSRELLAFVRRIQTLRV